MEIFVIAWFALLGYAVDQEYNVPTDGAAVTECYSTSPARACEGGGARVGWFGPPDTPEPPTEPPEPPVGCEGCKPGWGKGDKNHDHSGPPGQSRR